MGPVTDKLYDEGGLEIHIYGEVPDDIIPAAAARQLTHACKRRLVCTQLCVF